MEDKTSTWAAFGGEYIKALDVLSDTDEYAVVEVSSKFEQGKGDILHLTLERNGDRKLFGCNKTNTYAVQQECPNSPKDVIGRILTFNKVQVQKPGTDEIVDGLRIKFKQTENSEEPKQVDTEDAGIADDSTM